MGDPTLPLHAATRQYVDNSAGSSKPAFAAQLAVPGNYGNEVWTLVNFDTPTINQGSLFNIAGRYWQPPAGLVFLTANLYFSAGLLPSTPIYVGIYKNGASRLVSLGAAVGPMGGANITLIDTCNGSDYYQVLTYVHVAPGGATLLHGAGTTTFQGMKI